MSSNYMFAFRPRKAAPAPAPAPEPAPIGGSVRNVSVNANAAVTNANRFSLNRLMNLKSTGGCRSCS